MYYAQVYGWKWIGVCMSGNSISNRSWFFLPVAGDHVWFCLLGSSSPSINVFFFFLVGVHMFVSRIPVFCVHPRINIIQPKPST